MKKKENLNANHRSRLRKKYLNDGLELFEDHELLELLLFYTIPVVDTNKTAHRLLNTFGSLSGVFAADKEDLKKVQGIGDVSADFIKMINDVFHVYMQRERDHQCDIMNSENGMERIISLFEGCDERRFYMIFLGSEGRILSTLLAASGNFEYTDIDVRGIVESVMRMNAFSVVFAHNHLNGSLTPSADDIEFTAKMRMLFAFVDVELNDHIIVSGRLAASMKNDMDLTY